MSVRMQELVGSQLAALRSAPTPWRIRGDRAGATVADTRAALLVWEPKRVTPVYAVPREDLAGEIVEVGGPRPLREHESRRPVLDPSVPFDAHTSAGTVVAIRTASGDVPGFVVDDPDLTEHVLVDFDALDWREERDAVVAHPHDPLHRIDVHETEQHVVMSIDGTVVVDTRHAKMLAETMLPVRWYVPQADVLVPLEPSPTVTHCAYKGEAHYRSARLDDRLERDLFWVYESPARDGEDVRGLLGCYAERMTVTID